MDYTIENINLLLKQFHSLELSAVVDFDKFNQYAITHHSTTIEGSTLSEIETRLLLDEGITPGGKPLLHSLMVQDHFNALLFLIEKAKEKLPVTASFICDVNAKIMLQTGSLYHTVFGEIDAANGMFRKGNVRAGNAYFVSYDKVERLVKELCEKVKEKINSAVTTAEKLNISFDAHFELVSIHPFYDGNGRTSRLLMNFIQQYFNLPMCIVFKEDKAQYFEVLTETRKQENINIFRSFMYDQYGKYLQKEITLFELMLNNKENKDYRFLF